MNTLNRNNNLQNKIIKNENMPYQGTDTSNNSSQVVRNRIPMDPMNKNFFGINKVIK